MRYDVEGPGAMVPGRIQAKRPGAWWGGPEGEERERCIIALEGTLADIWEIAHAGLGGMIAKVVFERVLRDLLPRAGHLRCLEVSSSGVRVDRTWPDLASAPVSALAESCALVSRGLQAALGNITGQVLTPLFEAAAQRGACPPSPATHPDGRTDGAHH